MARMARIEAHNRIDDPAELAEAIAAALSSPEHTYREVVPGDAPDVEERRRAQGRAPGRDARPSAVWPGGRG